MEATSGPAQVLIYPNDVFIAVLGLTGSGKSSLIKICTEQDVPIGHDLKSFTASVSIYSTIRDSRRIHLIDTPGFDDTQRSESSVLQEIACWLSAAYRADQPDGKKGFLLDGIIYCQAINKPRWDGASARSLELLQAICGRDNYNAVTFVTTFWDVADQSKSDQFERQLTTSPHMLGEMLCHSPPSSYIRLDSGYASAAQLVNSIVRRNQKFVLQMQHELAQEGATLLGTTAGNKAGHLWEVEMDAFQTKMMEVRADVRKTDDSSGLKSEIEKLEQEIASSETAIKELSFNKSDLQKRYIQRSVEEVRKINSELEICRARLAVLEQHNCSTASPNPTASDEETRAEKELRQRQKDLQALKNTKIASRSMHVDVMKTLFGLGKLAIAAAPYYLAAHPAIAAAAGTAACAMCSVM